MPDLIIRSHQRSDELVLAPDVTDYWRATVELDGLRAAVRFYEPELGSLPAYFATRLRHGADGTESGRGSRLRVTAG
jgi:hypothetical protein